MTESWLTDMKQIQENVARVRAKIAEAALACGRDPGEILLCAATKMNDTQAVQAAIAAGVDCCGENRVQELVRKSAEGAYRGAPVHFIGHLQTNKVRQVVGHVDLIQSADRRSLLEVLEQEAARQGICQDVLLEVNIAGEESKSGFSPAQLWEELERFGKYCHLRALGLMAIPPVSTHPGENLQFFSEMRNLFVDISRKNTIMSLWRICPWECPATTRMPSSVAAPWSALELQFLDRASIVRNDCNIDTRRIYHMGFLDELKKLTKPYADDDEDDYDDYDDEPVEEEEPEPAPRTTRRSVTPPEPSYTHGSGLDSGRSTGSRIVNINTTTQLQVVLVKPERFDNVSEIADHLRDKHSVLLNLENTDRNIARRLVDFLSGCAYAVDGKIKKVAASAYLLTPYNVEIVGDLVEELENNGVYF